MDKILAFISICAFIVALGIFGAVENGAETAHIIWAVPALAISFFAAQISAKIKD